MRPHERHEVTANKFARSAGPVSSINAAIAYEPTRHTNKTIVANYLLDHAGEWIPASTFNDIAGRAGDRRMRELRQDGWEIETRRAAGNLYEHRLVKPPAKKVQAQFRKVTKVAKAA